MYYRVAITRPQGPGNDETMRSAPATFAAFLLASSVLAANAQAVADPTVGMITPDGHVFLYPEPVEQFWNDWTGMRVNNPESDQADIYIRAQGKAVEFNGVLSLNCHPLGLGHVWLAGAFSLGKRPATREFLNETIPQQVTTQAPRFFCD